MISSYVKLERGVLVKCSLTPFFMTFFNQNNLSDLNQKSIDSILLKFNEIKEFCALKYRDQKELTALVELIGKNKNNFSVFSFLTYQLDDYLGLLEAYEDNDYELLFNYYQDSEFCTSLIDSINSNLEESQVFENMNSLFFNAIKNIASHKFEGKENLSSKYFELGDKSPCTETIDDIAIRYSGNEKLKTKCLDIKNALNIIHEFSPQSYQSFKIFTSQIIGHAQNGIVSYSMESLPGVSIINFEHRDFVDLIDDLIHENGHHLMNAHLRVSELIHEDDDAIYFSPWRSSLRPVRGIYHAVFTFFMGEKLFYDLCNNIGRLELDDAEKNKIKRRFLEEYYMIDYCKETLNQIHKDEKMTLDGKSLIDQIIKMHNNFFDLFEKLNIEFESDKEIFELVSMLKDSQKYRNPL